jgi:AAA15 family ATPase/GTPase
MLKQIDLTNFRSFKDKQSFTMEALPPSSLKEHPEHIIPVEGGGVLKLASIYGPNGSGKSNLIKALSFFNELTRRTDFWRIHSFDAPFDNAWNQESRLSYTFINNEYEMVLSFSYLINQAALARLQALNAISGNEVPYLFVDEELNYRRIGDTSFQRVYRRNRNGIQAENLLKQIGVTTFAVPMNQLLVSYLSEQYRMDEGDFAIVNSCAQEMRSIVPLGNNQEYLLMFVFEKENCAYLAKTLNDILGTGITAIRLEQKDTGYGLDNLKFDHQQGNQKFTLSFYDESEGTQKLATIIAAMKNEAQGKIFYADDFDSHLHPVLIQALLSYLGSDENKNNQFIFNSHDILNMDSKYFRRDEIWFTTLDEEGATKLYALSDLNGPDGRVIRKDKKYSKQYLSGHYGADPFIAKGLKL